MAAGSELVEVVDEQGSVIDVVTRAEVRARNLRHRCTYVAVMTGDGQLVVHKRADWKDVYPSFWDICFGGLAGVGEAWDDAARRELAEEAGVAGVDLVPLGAVTYDADDGRIVGQAYVAIHDGAISCDDGEVVATAAIPIDQINEWLEDREVCPDSLMLVLPLVQAYVESGRS